jgi:hypothetical protein
VLHDKDRMIWVLTRDPGTADCAAYRIPETDVWLIDTPGFDDTTRSDAKILEEINRCLTEYFMRNARVTGVIYVHAITEPRMRGSAMKNLRMFRQVVGDENMKHCCLVTTKWSRQGKDVSQTREDELRNGDTFWKPLLKRGAKIKRFDDSPKSAMDIIAPFTLCDKFLMKLTKEYNLEGKQLDMTDAGREVSDDIEKAKKAHKEEIELLKEERARALKDKDEEMLKMIDDERRQLQSKIDEMKEGQELLKKKLADEKQELEQRLVRDREIRERDKKKMINKAWRIAARATAIGVGGAAIVATGGFAAPAAALMYARVEVALQIEKEKE